MAASKRTDSLARRRGGMLLPSLLLATLAPTALAAQVEPGARVRVTVDAPAPAVEVGRLDAWTDSALVVSADAATRTIPLSTVRRLEESLGRRPSVAGGIAGLVLGGAIGAVAGCAANRDSYGVFCGGQSDTKVALGAVVGGVVGATAGALLFRHERWRTVDLP